MENSDHHTSNDSNRSAADNDGHIFGEELAHKKEDNGESIKIEGALRRGNSHSI